MKKGIEPESAFVPVTEQLAKMTQKDMFVLINTWLERHPPSNTERKIRVHLLTKIGSAYIDAVCRFSDSPDELPVAWVDGPHYTPEEILSNFLKDWLGDLDTATLKQRFDLGDSTSAVRVIIVDSASTALQYENMEEAAHRAFSDLDVCYGILLVSRRHISKKEVIIFFRRLNGLRTCFRKKMDRLEEAVKALRT